MKNKFNFIKLSLLAFVGAFAGCDPCVGGLDFPVYLTDPCASVVYPGGIAGWVAKKCTYDFVDILDQAEWEAAILAGDVKGRFNGSRILGEMPAPDFATKVRGACGQEEVTRQSRTVPLQDAENDATFTSHDLYDFMSQFGSKFDFGFVTCDGRFYGFFSGSVRAWETIPQTNDDDSIFNIEFRYNEPIGVKKPLQLTFLTEIPLN